MRGERPSPVPSSLPRRRRVMAATSAPLLALSLAAGLTACGGPTAAPQTSTTTTTDAASRQGPDPETASALLRIARAFNEDYAHNRDGAVYDRWDAASRAIISRSGYIERHRACPPPGGNVKTYAVTRGTGGAWLVHYEIDGTRFTDYWYYVHGRFVFDLPKSNPSAVALYRLSPAQYAKRTGCTH